MLWIGNRLNLNVPSQARRPAELVGKAAPSDLAGRPVVQMDGRVLLPRIGGTT
jgi:hypothetical protein